MEEIYRVRERLRVYAICVFHTNANPLTRDFSKRQTAKWVERRRKRACMHLFCIRTFSFANDRDGKVEECGYWNCVQKVHNMAAEQKGSSDSSLLPKKILPSNQCKLIRSMSQTMLLLFFCFSSSLSSSWSSSSFCSSSLIH